MIYCSKCGCTVEAGAKKCSKCGQSSKQLPAPMAIEGGYLPPYASFADRVQAGIADAIILTVIETPIALVAGLMGEHHLIGSFFTVAISFSYYPILESSRLQATLGKRLFGLRVTDLNGKRISLLRAVVKQLTQSAFAAVTFGGLVMLAVSLAPLMKGSNLEMAGVGVAVFLANILYFAMHCAIVFTERRQSVFDKLTGRLVLKSPKGTDIAQPKLIQ